MPVGDVIQAKFACYGNSQVGLNIRHWVVSSETAGPPDPGEVAGDLSGAMAPKYKALISSTVVFSGVGVQKIWPLPVSVETAYVFDDGAGTAGATLLNSQASGLIKLTTGLAGRKNRGRVYVPFPAAGDDALTGVPITSYVTRLNTLANAFLATYTVTSTIVPGNIWVLSPVLWHRSTHTFTPLVSYVSRLGWATQRRRGFFAAANRPPF